MGKLLALGHRKFPPPKETSEELITRADELLGEAQQTTERLRRATQNYIERERGTQPAQKNNKPKRG